MSEIMFRTTRWMPLRRTAPTAVETTLTADRFLTATLPTDSREVEGFKGGRFTVFSNGANDETATLTFYAVEARHDGESFYVANIGTLAITLGTEVGVVGSDIHETLRFADITTWTASTFMTGLLTYTGGNAADVEPAANSIADLMISDFGNVTHITWRVTTFGLTAARFINTDFKLDR